jgi:hypothetical protein
MNILSTIVADVEKFFKGTGTDLEKFGLAFWKLFKKAPAALQTVENFVGELAPVITAAVALAAPAVEPEVAGALAIAETGLAAIEASAQAAVSGNSLLTNLEQFAATVPGLLTGLAIKDANLQATITKIVNLITGEAKVLIPAVQAWIAQIAAAKTPAAS